MTGEWGMAVGDELADAQLEIYLNELRSNPAPSLRDVGIDAGRAGARLRAANRAPGPEVFSVEDLELSGEVAIPARLYRPSEELAPLVVYFHGGGWTVGDLDTHDAVCRRFVSVGAVAVLAVDYRLAPEYPWPSAFADALSATRAALTSPKTFGGNGSLGVAGDSAGGHLAALVALALRGEPGALVAQTLIYPNTDLSFSQPSIEEKASGWGLSADTAKFFGELFAPDPALRADPALSPLAAPALDGLPESLVVLAEHDPLRDEGVAYAKRLEAAGIPTTWRVEPGLIHGFLQLDTVSPTAARAGDRIFAETGALLRSARVPGA